MTFAPVIDLVLLLMVVVVPRLFTRSIRSAKTAAVRRRRHAVLGDLSKPPRG